MKKKIIIRIVSTALAMVSAFFSVLGTSMVTYAAEPEDVMIVGHRGYSGLYPENTLVSFVAAANADVQWVEFDVRKSADGVLVIYHDDTLGRLVGDEMVTTGVKDFTYSQLLTLDAGAYLDQRFAGQQIPALDHVLSVLKDTDVNMVIELKDIGDDEDFAKEVYSRCREYDVLDRVIFASFRYDYLSEIKALNYCQPIMLLRNKGRARLTERFPADYYNINADNMRQTTIDKIHAAGAKAFVYTVDDKARMCELIKMGVDGIVTDYPDLSIL